MTRMQWATNAAVKMARNSKCDLMDGALPRRKRSGQPSWPGDNYVNAGDNDNAVDNDDIDYDLVPIQSQICNVTGPLEHCIKVLSEDKLEFYEVVFFPEFVHLFVNKFRSYASLKL